MPGPLPVEIRRQIVERRQAGEKLTEISEALNLSYNTVKRIWAHWLKHGKLAPNYEQARQKGPRKYAQVYHPALEMKREHPKWGSDLIRLRLQQTYATSDLPTARTLRRWFRGAGIAQSPRLQQCRSPVVRRGVYVHQVWAVDAKEQMHLADGSGTSWLMITDEASGAVLDAVVFPPLSVDEGASNPGEDDFADTL